MLENTFRYQRFPVVVFLASVFFFLGSSLSFAAPEVYTDLLMSTDVATFDMGMKVASITEDANQYSVGYTYDTLEIMNVLWQRMHKSAVMQISKKDLGERDLGVYIASQMQQIADQEKAYLKTVQKEAQKGKTDKPTTTTEYASLIGQSLDSEEKTFDGYQPVKPIVTEAVSGETSSAAAVLGADTEGTSTPVSSSAVTDELSSKVTALEEKLQTLADLVSTLTEFYTTFDLSSLLKQNQSGSEAENSSLSSAQ